MTKQDFSQQELERRFANDYDSIGDIHSGVALVERDDKIGAINTNGKIVIPLIYDYISDFRNNLAVAFIEDKGCLVNIKGEQISPLIYDDIATELRGELCAPKFSCGLVKVRIDEKYGFINELGELAIQAIYDSAEDFTNVGMARVCINGKYGFINNMGELTTK